MSPASRYRRPPGLRRRGQRSREAPSNRWRRRTRQNRLSHIGIGSSLAAETASSPRPDTRGASSFGRDQGRREIRRSETGAVLGPPFPVRCGEDSYSPVPSGEEAPAAVAPDTARLHTASTPLPLRSSSVSEARPPRAALREVRPSAPNLLLLNLSRASRASPGSPSATAVAPRGPTWLLLRSKCSRAESEPRAGPRWTQPSASIRLRLRSSWARTDKCPSDPLRIRHPSSRPSSKLLRSSSFRLWQFLTVSTATNATPISCIRRKPPLPSSASPPRRSSPYPCHPLTSRSSKRTETAPATATQPTEPIPLPLSRSLLSRTSSTSGFARANAPWSPIMLLLRSRPSRDKRLLSEGLRPVQPSIPSPLWLRFSSCRKERPPTTGARIWQPWASNPLWLRFSLVSPISPATPTVSAAPHIGPNMLLLKSRCPRHVRSPSEELRCLHPSAPSALWLKNNC
mmetsp:Transcript_41632/g.111624  ORF Transcript_41632/g.111624 Transcript_41632/m.111624 type:complete len:457 (+) Transcript_41632:205-1575(+)